jgi:hypothetical protein
MTLSRQLDEAVSEDRSMSPGKAAGETGLGVGSVFQDTTGSRFKVLARYRDGQDRGYRCEALGGSRLTKAGSIYHVPFERVDKVIRRVGHRPAPVHEEALAEARLPRDWSKDQRWAFRTAVENPGKTVDVKHPKHPYLGSEIEYFFYDEARDRVTRYYSSPTASRGEETYHDPKTGKFIGRR